jgi:CheY-like chemotaxis protein
MGRSVTVSSAPGKGSIFTVRLPAEAAAPMSTVETSAAETGPAANQGSRGTVLVIDDDATARELIATHLAGNGFAVETAANGVDGLKRARELRPAAITLDIVMPNIHDSPILPPITPDPPFADTPGTTPRSSTSSAAASRSAQPAI